MWFQDGKKDEVSYFINNEKTLTSRTKMGILQANVSSPSVQGCLPPDQMLLPHSENIPSFSDTEPTVGPVVTHWRKVEIPFLDHQDVTEKAFLNVPDQSFLDFSFVHEPHGAFVTQVFDHVVVGPYYAFRGR